MFMLYFRTDNDAFCTIDGPHVEVARILRDTANRVDGFTDDGYIRDVNGNNIGRFSLTKPAE